MQAESLTELVIMAARVQFPAVDRPSGSGNHTGQPAVRFGTAPSLA
jgi:hypothetical protein